MPDANPIYSRGGGGGLAGGPPPSTAAGPGLTTSVYETHLGPVALTWTRTILGLSLRVNNRLDGGEAAGGDSDEEEEEGEEMHIRFRVRPWLFWKRRGSKRFHLKDKRRRRRRSVDVAWDLSRARFPASGGPEPASGFFVAVTVDGEMLLVAGDLVDEAYKKTKAQKPSNPFWKPVLISRREHTALVDAGGQRSHRTWARFGGREREITIEIVGKGKDKEAGMAVAVDGDRVLQIRRLRWKFRGSEKLDVEGGGSIQVSWDLHDWLFHPREAAASAVSSSSPAGPGQAVFVFRFEPDEWNRRAALESLRKESLAGKGESPAGRDGNWSESSVGGERARRSRRSRSLMKMGSSASSTSSVSSAASGSTVMEWASQEEVELQQAEGFSLVVNAWKR